MPDRSGANPALRTAAWMIGGGLALALVGWLPLQLVIWFGPDDANPIGFGILMALAVPAGLITAAAGIAYALVALLLARNG